MEEKYEVIHHFKDMDDNDHLYIAGKDLYPREGLEPTKTRIKELSTKKNLIGEPCIRKICKK